MNSSAASPPALDGQWGLITGAGKRIGACIAQLLHQHGMNIAVHYRSSVSEADEVASELNAVRPNSAITVQADLLNNGQLAPLVDQVIAASGRLDLLLNNASTFYPTPLDTVTEEQWDDLFGTNLKAPLFLAKAAAPHLRRTGGTIINIVDIHAQRPLRNHPIYGPAKAGLAMLTRALAKDLAPEIRVNGVAPGAILWPNEGIPAKAEAAIIRQIPLNRTGGPTDIAKTVLFLVKDAPYITGQIIAVDGGRNIGW